MKILFVLECAHSTTNGTGATCLRFAKELEKKGHEVSIIGLDPGNKDHYHRYIPLPKYKFPFADNLIVSDGFVFVKVQYDVLYEAIKGKDLVHLFLPFKLQNKARLIAQELGVAVTGAFHMFPQNVTSAMHLGKWRLLNNTMFLCFKNYIYNHVRLIHCPSKMIADELKRHHYNRNEFRVISNGVIPYFKKMEVERPKEFDGKFVIMMAGRLADEKRQDLIIKAAAKSKYNDKIQVVLCGKGPNEKGYYRLAKKRKLANPLSIKFCNQEELRNVYNYIDLYIHASDFEIEGISAIEAITCGVVPLISDARLSATKDFSLDDEHCVFKHGSVKDLTRKIDWFIEHPEEHKDLAKRYLEDSKKYALTYQVDELEKMFYDAIDDLKNERDNPHVYPRRKDKRFLKKIHRKMKKIEKKKKD